MVYLTSASTTNIRKLYFDPLHTLKFLLLLIIIVTTTGRFDSVMVLKAFCSEFSTGVFC